MIDQDLSANAAWLHQGVPVLSAGKTSTWDTNPAIRLAQHDS